MLTLTTMELTVLVMAMLVLAMPVLAMLLPTPMEPMPTERGLLMPSPRPMPMLTTMELMVLAMPDMAMVLAMLDTLLPMADMPMLLPTPMVPTPMPTDMASKRSQQTPIRVAHQVQTQKLKSKQNLTFSAIINPL